jgi:hypothetical protein
MPGGMAGFGAFVAIMLTNENGEESEGGIDRGAALASTQEGRTTAIARDASLDPKRRHCGVC